jgi:hypothetical protein
VEFEVYVVYASRPGFCGFDGIEAGVFLSRTEAEEYIDQHYDGDCDFEIVEEVREI